MNYGSARPKNVGQLREAIHGALEYLRYSEIRPPIDFKQAFSATDALLDIEEALFAAERYAWPDELGQSYIYGIGILQALVIQQDSVRLLCGAIGVPDRIYIDKDLVLIRNYRVRAAGHPANHSHPSQGSTFLIRERFTKTSAKFTTYFDNPKSIKHSDINFSALINSQERALARILKLAWAKILIDFPIAAERGWDPWIAREIYPGGMVSFDFKESA